MKKAIYGMVSLVLAAVMLLSAVVVAEAKSTKLTVTENGITWTLYDNGELVVSGKGEIKKNPVGSLRKTKKRSACSTR